jgi:hypothetical protein
LAQVLELADHPLALRLSTDDEAPVPGLVAVMREAQKIERLGTAKLLVVPQTFKCCQPSRFHTQKG